MDNSAVYRIINIDFCGQSEKEVRYNMNKTAKHLIGIYC